MIIDCCEIVVVVRRPSGAIRDVRVSHGGGISNFLSAVESVKQRFSDSHVIGWRDKSGAVRQIPNV